MPTHTHPRIGILTGGGDCPGLNAVIRAVTLTARRRYGATVLGIEDGFEGLIEGRGSELTEERVAGILQDGGTILGSSNKGDPWRYPVVGQDGKTDWQDCSGRLLAQVQHWQLDGVVVVGGDGTMQMADRLQRLGVGVVGVPKTIDNDLLATDQTFGFDTATAVVSEALDRLTTTASSHHRVMVLEVMGRTAGWIALMGGVAGGADVILLPEIPFQWQAVFDKVKARAAMGMRYSIICVAEGAQLPTGGEVVQRMDRRRTDPKRLGGIGAVVAEHIEAGTGLEARVTVLGHLQRGGSPTAFDRILATRLGSHAADCICRGESGVLVAYHQMGTCTVPLSATLAGRRNVPADHDLIQAARALGTCFGDEAGSGRA
ncbi:6-phosphofructokinase [Leeia sp.]|uniref:6-phosphofructokinase n=1 Tax=Leeia sp. TaxID=2884678 RepID=UPI0035B4BE86